VTRVAWLLAVLGALGAADTLYYHEWRARLPSLGAAAAEELRLHAMRDFLYAALFGLLPSFAFAGLAAAPLALLLLAEIVITLKDFVVEDRVRKPLGGVYPGERVMHAVMGIVYGAMLANLVPLLLAWTREAPALRPHDPAVPLSLRALLFAMAAGVLASGVRDLRAASGRRS
jgi:hypothetical protein